jgi:polyisoprenoid-binding protein YceI
MRNYRIVLAIGLLVVTLLPLVVTAQQSPPSSPESYKVDPVHACVLFRIKHLDIAWFYGRFNEIEGTFVVDKSNPANNQIDIKVNAASIDTNHEGRDKHLRAPDFFNTDSHAFITFKSKRGKMIDAETCEMQGELTLLGKTRPLTCRIEHTGAGKDPWGNYRAGFETTFTIKRSEFGMTALPGGLSDDVRLTVSVEGIREKK